MMSQFASEMSECVEEMIEGEENVAFTFTEETLTAKLQSKLRRLYEILQSKEKASTEEKEALQSLVADISHQVKAPLANIKMTSGILADREMPEEQRREFLQSLSAQAEKLEFLMQAMIKMSRLETGVFEMHQNTQSIFDTLADALSGVQAEAERKNISVSVECDEGLSLPHDTKWTAEALFNIIDNAVKYTPAGGSVSIKVTRMEFYTKIAVLDTGKGISEENHGAIFLRFFREADAYNSEGAGLGLYIARQIVSMQGGYIKVKSSPGEGAEFSVFLPNEQQNKKISCPLLFEKEECPKTVTFS
jgi:signal transduction histidine kinase